MSTQPTMSGVFVNWTTLKAIVVANSLTVNYTEDTKKYNIWTHNGPSLIRTALYKPGIVVGGLDQTQNDNDRTDFETNYKPTANSLEKMAIRIETDQELNVNVISSGIDKKLRYDQMTRNQTVANGSYTQLYSYSGTGKVSGIYLKFSFKTMQVRVTIDGVNVIDNFDLEDLPKGNGANENMTPFIMRPSDNELSIQFPGDVKFDSGISIHANGSMDNKNLSWGYVVITKET